MRSSDFVDGLQYITVCLMRRLVMSGSASKSLFQTYTIPRKRPCSLANIRLIPLSLFLEVSLKKSIKQIANGIKGIII